MGGFGCWSESVSEPPVVDPGPLTVGAHFVQPSVDEADEIHVLFVEAQSVRLRGERLLLWHHRVRVLRGETGKHGVVPCNSRHLALLEERPGSPCGCRQPTGMALGASLIRLSMLEVPIGAQTFCPASSVIELILDPLRTKIFWPDR